ncbi:hypothetical protein [Streptomyces sp. 2R]|uniref:hypothetical protein n=1 Tax=Streptomyces sp. 2R TaxID=1883452 RepID=UPI00117C8971|nr:hypothetical protein [Streptomyces sp. 2R]
MTKMPDTNDHHGLFFVRDIEAAEKLVIDESMNLLRSFSANWEWTKASDSLTRIRAVFADCSESTEKANGNFSENDRTILSRTVRESAEVISSWPERILSDESRHLGVDSESRERITEAARRALDSNQILSVLRKISQHPDDSLVSIAQASPAAGGGYVAYFEKEVLREAGVENPANWMVEEIFTLSLARLQLVAAEILTSYRGKIEDAGRVILGLHGEVLYGQPVLALKDDLQAGSGNISLTPVENPNLEGILRAADSAASVLTQDNHAQSQVRRPLNEAPSPKPSDSTSSDSADTQEIAASDLRSLLHHVGKLNTDMEKAWSLALDGERHKTHGEMLAKWFSFAESLKSYIAQQYVATGEGREGKAMMTFPLDAQHFGSIPATLSDALGESGVAEVYAMRNLLHLLRGLQQPTIREMNLVTGEETTWWESGAFSQVRRAADLAIRVVHRRDDLVAAQVESSGRPEETAAPVSEESAFLYAQLCRVSLYDGLPEATVVYAAMALRRIAAIMGCTSNDGAAVVESIARIGSRWKAPAEVTLNAAADIGNGVVPSLENIVNVGNFWSDEIGTLCQAVMDLRERPQPQGNSGEGN